MSYSAETQLSSESQVIFRGNENDAFLVEGGAPDLRANTSHHATWEPMIATLPTRSHEQPMPASVILWHPIRVKHFFFLIVRHQFEKAQHNLASDLKCPSQFPRQTPLSDRHRGSVRHVQVDSLAAA